MPPDRRGDEAERHDAEGAATVRGGGHILTAPRRTASGYRVYSAETLPVLTFVRQAQRLGFTLDAWGERLLNRRVVRLVLNAERERRLKGAYRRHAGKTIFLARHVMGLRAAAFVTAGIAHVPFWKFLAVDGMAAALGVPVGFGLAYVFTDDLEQVMADVHRVQHWLGLLVVVGIVTALALTISGRSRRSLAEDV